MAVPKINTAKLRRLMAERNQRGQAVRQITDNLIEVREQIGRLEASLANEKNPSGENPQTRQEVEDLREHKAELERQRDLSARRFEEFAFVDDLVEYARGLGYYIDSIAGTITKPVKDTRKGPHIPRNKEPVLVRGPGRR